MRLPLSDQIFEKLSERLAASGEILQRVKFGSGAVSKAGSAWRIHRHRLGVYDGTFESDRGANNRLLYHGRVRGCFLQALFM